MDSRQLEYFVAVVDEQSFSRAASRLFITQPALSQRIQKLEASIGVELIDRSVRPFKLTPVAQRVYMEAQKVLGNLKEIGNIADQAVRGDIGRLRIGIVPSLLFGPIPSVLRDFQREYPQMELVLERHPTSVLRQRFAQRSLDVLLLFTPSKLSHSAGRVLYREQFLVALPRDHPLASLPLIQFSQLEGEQITSGLREEAPENHDSVVEAAMSAGFSPKLKVMRGTYLEQIGFVSAGFGIAIVPETFSRYNAPDVVFRPLIDPNLALDMNVDWEKQSKDPVVANFVQYLTNEMARRGFSPPD